MYAVIESGGKQHRVTEGDEIQVEKLDIETGKEVDFDRVLMVAGEGNVQVGSPTVEGAQVTATVKGHLRGKKIIVYFSGGRLIVILHFLHGHETFIVIRFAFLERFTQLLGYSVLVILCSLPSSNAGSRRSSYGCLLAGTKLGWIHDLQCSML